MSPRKDKHLKAIVSMIVRDHILNCNFVVVWEDFSIIGRWSNHYLLKTKVFLLKDTTSIKKEQIVTGPASILLISLGHFCVKSMIAKMLYELPNTVNYNSKSLYLLSIS